MVPFNTLPSNSGTVNGETKPMGTDKSHEQSKSSVQSKDYTQNILFSLSCTERELLTKMIIRW